ncbi:hypothetical protein CDAR_374771 [Caerostris darwini]|uniref:Methylosome subunit pICln n=1 Tax=Caerostris darwini TaxID=1538125 RepID=A0AAV4RQ83_9ARAC|nr:hypothetical protein CDAR_374771 [Caerostris darwini]
MYLCHHFFSELEDLSSSETVQLEGAMNSMNVNECDGDDIDDEEMDPNLLYLVPDNKNSLDDMFKAITICQNLNPEEPCEDDDDDDGFDDLPFDIQVASGELEDYENGDEEFSDMDEGQFEDAE